MKEPYSKVLPNVSELHTTIVYVRQFQECHMIMVLLRVYHIWTILCIGRPQAAGMYWKHSTSEYPALIKLHRRIWV